MTAPVASLPSNLALPVNPDNPNLQKDHVALCDSPALRDSGYSSVAKTPDKITANSQVHSEQGKASACSKPPDLFALAGAGGLRRFDKDVDKATIDRFKDVLEQIEGPLLAHMQKSRKKYRPMAIRLMVLGKSDEDAKPYVVVLCNEGRYRRVERFFDTKLAKDVCRPQGSTLPSFDVCIVRQSPQPTAAETVYLSRGPVDTFDFMGTACGSIIKIVASEKARFATLGGVIKLVAGGDYALYGMTAGHSAGGWDDDKDEEGESDGDGVSSDSDSEADTLENDDVSPTDKALCRAASPPRSPRLPNPNLEFPENWERWGSILPSRRDWERRDERNHDWALVEIESEVMFGANRLIREESGRGRGELREPSEGLRRAQLVVMISGFQGPKRGKLSSLPSMLLLAPGRKFVQTYVLALDGGCGMIGLNCLASLAGLAVTDH